MSQWMIEYMLLVSSRTSIYTWYTHTQHRDSILIKPNYSQVIYVTVLNLLASIYRGGICFANILITSMHVIIYSLCYLNFRSLVLCLFSTKRFTDFFSVGSKHLYHKYNAWCSIASLLLSINERLRLGAKMQKNLLTL